MPEIREAVIVEAVRTPIGKRNGSLKDIHPVDLLAEALKEVVARSRVDPGEIEDNITGCVSQVGEQSINVGRNGWLAAGFPETIPSTTVDRQCGSSQQAIHFAAQGVMAGAYDLVVASGVENMTRVPMGSSMAGANPFGQQLFARYEGKLVPQGISADLIATKWDISREESDDFAFRSHLRAAAATRAGLRLEEMDVVEINEAFASIVIAWKRELGIPDEWFEEHVNPNGGAIAVGHPLGATGAKLMTTMLHELERRGGRYGLQTMCEGGGMANATVIERLD